METFTIHADNVKVEEIMQEIQRRVLEKKQAGIYSDEEIQRITELKQDLSPKKNERYSELNLYLRKMHRHWDVAASATIITSHRKILGPVMVAIKKIGFRILRFIGSAFFTRQTEYNAAGVRFSSVVLEELTRLQQENRQLRQVQEDMLHQIRELQQQVKSCE